MKWIGQHIWDQVSKFRNDIYLEGISTSTETDMLVIDSNNKVSKRAIDAITVDVSDFLTDGADNRVVTATGTDALLAETYLTFQNTGNVSTLSLLSDQDTGDLFSIATTTHGATTLTTTDDDATAAHFEIAADGDIILDSAGCIDFEPGTGFCTLTNTTASASNTGGSLNLISNDGAALGDDHRLGKIGFQAAEDGSGTIREGATIKAFADAAWSASENGTRLEFYTMDGNNASELSLTLDSDLLATFAGAVTVTGALTGTLATVSQPNITGIGTIGTGVWEGTAIATDQQKHLMHYEFMGFNNSTADTVYEFAESMNDTKAPLEHTADHNATITTAMVVGTYFKAGGQVIPQAGTIKRIVGWAHTNGTSAEHKLALVMLRPAENDSTAVAPVLVDEITWTSLGGNKLKAINETTITAAGVNAGDILMTMIKDDTGGRQVFFNITVELEV